MVSTGVAEGADGVDMDVADGDGEPLLAALRAASRVANTSATSGNFSKTLWHEKTSMS